MRVFGAVMALVLSAASPGVAAEFPRALSHYTHQKWSEESDPPLPSFAIAQSRDGFLWVAAALALYRFDGTNFDRIAPEGADERDGSPLDVLVTREGDVWTAFATSGRFAVYRDGALRYVPAPEPGGTVVKLIQAKDGAVWAGLGETGRGLMRHAAGRWTRFGRGQGLPNDELMGLEGAADGAVWAAFINGVYRLAPGGARFERVLASPAGHARIAQDPQGRVWLYDTEGVRPLTGPGGRGRPGPLRFAWRPEDSLVRGNLTFDRAGNLWIATRTNGIRRITRPDPSGAVSRERAVSDVEAFRTADGLTSNETGRIFEDQEGNIWTPTEAGLDKFRPASIRTVPALGEDRAALGDVLLGASDGSVFIGQARTLWRVAPGGVPAAVLTGLDEPEALCEAPDGEIWIVTATRVLGWKDGRARRAASRPAAAGVYDCGFDRRGDLWISAGGDGLLRWRGGRWEPVFGAGDETTYHPTTMVRDVRGRMVVHWAPQTLAWIDGQARSWAPIEYGEERPILRSLYALPDGDVLAAGTFGLARFAEGRPALTVGSDRMEGLRGLRGIVQTRQGWTWLATQTAVAVTATEDLNRAFRDLGHVPRVLALSFEEGLPARVVPQSRRALVQGGDGRLWIATLAGSVWLDPNQILRNPIPPKVAVGRIEAGGRVYRDPQRLSFPAGTADVHIAYSVLSFANPKAVAFRYRLEGYDRDWVDPGLRREAFYTNLPPGKYRFKVVAASNENVWNNDGAVVEFEIPPTFLQSHWFVLLCLVAVGGLVWMGYRLRLAQASAAIRARLEERMGERERIARELHDTFLQSVQGLILRFQAVADRMAPDDAGRAGLEAALTRADGILAEGRSSLRDLRDSEGSDDARVLFRAMAAQLEGEGPPVEIVVEGPPRALSSLVGAELVRIVREAVLNARRHANASRVEVHIAYRPHDLQVTVRDDGDGLPSTVVALGRKKDHYGLVGMRERAERMGADIGIANRPSQGAEVVLTLPAKLAFASRHRRWAANGRDRAEGGGNG